MNNRTWHVFVHTVNVHYVGAVNETTETLARCAALSTFGEAGTRAERGEDQPWSAIYEDDEFEVRPA